MKNNFIKCLSFLIILFIGILFLIASASTPKQTAAPLTKSVRKPSLVPVENYPQTIEKNGVRISVEPYEFTIHKKMMTLLRPQSSLISVRGKSYYNVITQPVLLTPQKLKFKVRINNNLDHVLRLAGSVLAFQVNNKSIATDDSKSHNNFLNGIILPRQQSEFVISGPKISTLSENDPIAFLLYDLTTKTDSAGNATERTNFEWFYKVHFENVTVQVPPTTKESGYFTKAEAESLNKKMSDIQ